MCAHHIDDVVRLRRRDQHGEWRRYDASRHVQFDGGGDLHLWLGQFGPLLEAHTRRAVTYPSRYHHKIDLLKSYFPTLTDFVSTFHRESLEDLVLYCPTGLFIGISVLIPQTCVMVFPVLLWIAYHVPVDGRHTAKSVLPSPS